MQAYEFYAKPENGVISIPEQYRNLITEDVVVIILEKKSWNFDRENANTRIKADLLLSPTLDTRGWKFEREEANER